MDINIKQQDQTMDLWSIYGINGNGKKNNIKNYINGYKWIYFSETRKPMVALFFLQNWTTKITASPPRQRVARVHLKPSDSKYHQIHPYSLANLGGHGDNQPVLIWRCPNF